MPESLVHLRVPAALKGRWIRASRAAGMRLTDWITQAVEAHMTRTLATLQIPDDLDFSALKLSRAADGGVSFDWAPIARICAASGVDPAVFSDGPEDNVGALIARWYHAHRARGGAPDPVHEDLIAEAAAEDAAGQPVSLQPGRA